MAKISQKFLENLAANPRFGLMATSRQQEVGTALEKAKGEAAGMAQTPTGGWVDVSGLPPAEQAAIRSGGIEEWRRKYFVKTEAGKDDWVRKEWYETLSDTEKPELMQLGSAAFTDKYFVKVGSDELVKKEWYESLKPEEQAEITAKGLKGSGYDYFVSFGADGNLIPTRTYNEFAVVGLDSDELVNKGWYENLNPEEQAEIKAKGTKSIDYTYFMKFGVDKNLIPVRVYNESVVVGPDGDELVSKEWYGSLEPEEQAEITAKGVKGTEYELFAVVGPDRELVTNTVMENLMDKNLYGWLIPQEYNYYQSLSGMAYIDTGVGQLEKLRSDPQWVEGETVFKKLTDMTMTEAKARYDQGERMYSEWTPEMTDIVDQNYNAVARYLLLDSPLSTVVVMLDKYAPEKLGEYYESMRGYVDTLVRNKMPEVASSSGSVGGLGSGSPGVNVPPEAVSVGLNLISDSLTQKQNEFYKATLKSMGTKAFQEWYPAQYASLYEAEATNPMRDLVKTPMGQFVPAEYYKELERQEKIGLWDLEKGTGVGGFLDLINSPGFDPAQPYIGLQAQSDKPPVVPWMFSMKSIVDNLGVDVADAVYRRMTDFQYSQTGLEPAVQASPVDVTGHGESVEVPEHVESIVPTEIAEHEGLAAGATIQDDTWKNLWELKLADDKLLADYGDLVEKLSLFQRGVGTSGSPMDAKEKMDLASEILNIIQKKSKGSGIVAQVPIESWFTPKIVEPVDTSDVSGSKDDLTGRIRSIFLPRSISQKFQRRINRNNLGVGTFRF